MFVKQLNERRSCHNNSVKHFLENKRIDLLNKFEAIEYHKIKNAQFK